MEYVCGFMFQSHFGTVVLIRKNKPEWQKGKLNGVGGKIEPGEQPIQAMVREFEEETGFRTEVDEWSYLRAERFVNGVVVHFFYAVNDGAHVESKTDEEVRRYNVAECLRIMGSPLRQQCMYNLPYLFEMARAMHYLDPANRPLP